MATARLSMRAVREVLRLRWGLGRSQRETARSVGISATAVCDCVRRARAAGLSWPLAADLDDAALEARLYPPAPSSRIRRARPDWSEVHQDLRRKGMTLELLWQEYREAHAEELTYSYSQFCARYREWRSQIEVVMRQQHRAGEKTFVDFSGQKLEIVDPRSGEIHLAEVFVAVLGASSFTYAEATASQDLHDWVGAHVRTFEYCGGVTEILVPDNLKAGVTKSCRYEPLVNRTYEEMAAHYGAVVIPARAHKPRDKAKAEQGVQMVQRWILASLRKQRLFSLAEANEQIRRLLRRLNDRPMRGLGRSRRELFEELDRPALRPLPSARYEIAQWKKVRAGIDYHVEVDRHYYSVPHSLAGRSLEARATGTTVEVFEGIRRVAAHVRNFEKGRHTTIPEHMPKAHRKHQEWSPSRLVSWGRKTGPETGRLVAQILESRPHPEQGYRSCLGLLRLGRRFGAPRLEAACRRALHCGTPSYRSVKSILSAGLDAEPLPFRKKPSRPLPPHGNVRGADYYQ